MDEYGNGGMMWGESWIWIIVVFALLFGWGNGGAGFAGGGNRSGAADNYVLTSDFANIERKLDGVNNGLCDGFYTNAQLIAGVNQNMATGFANAELSRANTQAATMQQLFNMQMAQQNCCCENRAAIADVKYNIATGDNQTQNVINNGTRDLIENQNANTRAILDALNTQAIAAKDAKIAEQNQQIFSLQLAASQQAQNNYLLGQLKQAPVPAYVVQNPYCCATNTGCGCA